MAASTWNIDPTHSDVLFSAKHMMVTTVRGKFASVSGSIEGDPQDPSGAKGTFTIDVASLNTGVEQRDGQILLSGGHSGRIGEHHSLRVVWFGGDGQGLAGWLQSRSVAGFNGVAGAFRRRFCTRSDYGAHLCCVTAKTQIGEQFQQRCGVRLAHPRSLEINFQRQISPQPHQLATEQGLIRELPQILLQLLPGRLVGMCEDLIQIPELFDERFRRLGAHLGNTWYIVDCIPDE